MESHKNTLELDPSSEEEPVQPAEEPLQLTPDDDKNVLTDLHQTPLTPKARPETVHQDLRPTASTSCTPDSLTRLHRFTHVIKGDQDVCTFQKQANGNEHSKLVNAGGGGGVQLSLTCLFHR